MRSTPPSASPVTRGCGSAGGARILFVRYCQNANLSRFALSSPESFLPLHPLELGILVILLEGEAHAYRIVSELERREPAVRIYPANLYRRLREMVSSGLLEEEPVPAEADGRRRRYFRVTVLGRSVARAEALRVQRVLEAARDVGLLSS